MARFVEILLDAAPCPVARLSPPREDCAFPRLQRSHPYWEQVTLPRLLSGDEQRVLLCGFNTAPLVAPRNVRVVQVVHDLIFMSSSRELPWSSSRKQNLGRLYRRVVVPRSAPRAAQVITVSAASRSELNRLLGIPPERIDVVPNAIDTSLLAPPPIPWRERSDFVLTVSGEAPNKNLQGTIAVFASVAAQPRFSNVKLVVLGVSPASHARYLEMARQAGVGDRVSFLGRVGDEELMRLHRLARAYLCTSVQEGFGIPLIEAMAVGTPVVSSNTTAMPEVVDNAGLLFDPRDAAAGALALAEVLSNQALAIRLAQAGRDRVRQHYTRDRALEIARAVWTKVLR
jgi:glycosyltransferase involved in cell wall biosynthesis